MRVINLENILFVDIVTDQQNDSGSILCICVGKINTDNKSYLNLRCFYNENETKLLQEFSAFLSFLSNKTRLYQFDNAEFNINLLLSRLESNGIKHNCKKINFEIHKSIENTSLNTEMHRNAELEIEDKINNSYLEIVNTVQLLLSVKKLSTLATENIYYV